MSSEMAVTDNNSGKETEAMDCDLTATASGEGQVEPSKSPVKEEPKEDSKKDSQDQEMEVAEGNVKKTTKRKASVLSDQEDDDFRGFDSSNILDKTADVSKVLDRIEADISAVSESFTPVRNVSATPKQPRRIGKRVKSITTDVSRPSSVLSSHSDGDGVSTDHPSSATSSPAGSRGRRTTTEMSSPLLRVPLELGWKRELVHRAALDQYSRRNADIYYYTPKGKKLRSTREVSEHLSGTGLTLENFSFFKEPLGVDDPEKEIIRDAKLVRRVESPLAAAPPVEGRRVVKPKVPKGAEPEPAHTPPSKATQASKIKVKSLGSRLSTSKTTPQQEKQEKQKKTTSTPNADNNNTTWKKPSALARGRLSNGAPLLSPSKPTKPLKPDTTDYFTQFCKRKEARPAVIQIFQYLGMRELAQCARVCKLWHEITSSSALWKHVRMKNSHVSDWAGLCARLKRHGTKRLDLRKMLLPHNDTAFWESFVKHIRIVKSLERLELCRCPSSAVESVCSGVPWLVSLVAGSVRESRLDPRPLSQLARLTHLRLKSLTGLTLSHDLTPLATLTSLTHLSLTSIKELGTCACEVVGKLVKLESLELGECSFVASFGDVLCSLRELRRLRLERGTAECAAPALLRALADLPKLTQLELVNFDVKVGFDEALAQCKNVQRLLIIPTYVSQSATTNKQVLSGVLRLKDSLTHLMWGVTIELLRVTELFIDQCDQGGDSAKKDIGECIPVLKPIPGCALPDEHHHNLNGPPQVEILPLPTLQRLLSAQLPHTRLKLLRIPFHATWRQSLADFQ